MTSPHAENAVSRLTRALELFLAHQQTPTDSRHAFLERHADLRELLEPMFDEPNDTAATERTFGPYRVLGEIARGGMGVVHDAMEPVLNRCVVLKLIGHQVDA